MNQTDESKIELPQSSKTKLWWNGLQRQEAGSSWRVQALLQEGSHSIPQAVADRALLRVAMGDFPEGLVEVLAQQFVTGGLPQEPDRAGAGDAIASGLVQILVKRGRANVNAVEPLLETTRNCTALHYACLCDELPFPAQRN